MGAKNAFDHGSHAGTDAFFNRPVDRGVAADGIYQLKSNLAQGLVTQDFHRTVVYFQRIVEGQLIVAQVELFTSAVGLAQAFGHVYQFGNDLSSVQGSVLIFLDALLQHVREQARLDQVLSRLHFDLIVEQLAQGFNGEFFPMKGCSRPCMSAVLRLLVLEEGGQFRMMREITECCAYETMSSYAYPAPALTQCS
jgi:hypothetical protein